MTLPYDTILLHESIVHTKLHSYRILDDYYKPYTDKKLHELLLKNAWIRDSFGSRNEFFCQHTIYEIRVRKNKHIHNIRSCNKNGLLRSVLFVD